jgi:hypothetical protein
LQALLVSAVSAVLVTRLYLSLTGYPRIGSGPLHIAHLLWGGLLMLAALVLLQAFLGKRAKRVAAILGGLGLGLFVDEIGKFVTADNDYFFRPSIALIYILFIALFLVFRAIERQSLSPHELLVNAADTLREIVLSGATRREVVRARRLVDLSGQHGPLAEALRNTIETATRVPEHKSPLSSFANWAWHAYDHLLAWPWFHRAVWLVFVGQAVVGLLTTAAVAWATFNGASNTNAVEVVSSSVSLALVLVGVARLPRSRLGAYRWFERSILISVFFTQIVLFWHDQLTALGGLFWDLVLLAVLRFLERQETARIVTER